MNRFLHAAVVCALILAMPIATLADNHGNSGGGQGGGSRGGGGRNAVPSRPAPPPPRNPGFNMPHDTNHPPTPVRPMPITEQERHMISQPGASNFVHPSFNGNVTGGPYHGRFKGPVIRNPHNWSGWGWNRGVAWYPVPLYWGGGFWGGFAFGALTSAVLFGSVVDYQDQVIYPSYEIAPDSPGAQLLENYQLQQTDCGPPNLVVIWGPDNSVICAYPNNLVAPGNYELDPATLTITSSS